MRELRAARALKGLSQQDVANHLGISTATYQRFESNLGGMRIDQLLDLADLLEVPAVDILDWRTSTRRGVVRCGDLT